MKIKRTTVASGVLLLGLSMNMNGVVIMESLEFSTSAGNYGSSTFGNDSDYHYRTAENSGVTSSSLVLGPPGAMTADASTNNDALRAVSSVNYVGQTSGAEADAVINQVYRTTSSISAATVNLDIRMDIDGFFRVAGSLSGAVSTDLAYGLNILREDGSLTTVFEYKAANFLGSGATNILSTFGTTTDAAAWDGAWTQVVDDWLLDFDKTYNDAITVNTGESFQLQWYLRADASQSAQGHSALADFGNTAYINVSTDDAGATLNFVPIPEPSVALLGLVSIFGLSLRRQR